jgi:hypothetical protein
MVGLERCLEYRLGCGWYPVYGMGMWMAWKGTSCMNWDGGWIGKVSGVRFGLWSVPNMQNGIVDSLDGYLVYGMGMWMVWNGAQSTVWMRIVSIIEARV